MIITDKPIINYTAFLESTGMWSPLPPPGWLYDEVEDSGYFDWRNGTWVYDDSRIAFEETNCAVCGETIGPCEGCDPETGYSKSDWIMCFSGPLGLICEPCCTILDPCPPFLPVGTVSS